MANKLQFDVGMNNTEAMTGTKEIARAMASLESTVKNVSKGMASSLTGYSDAIQRNVKATHDYNAEMRKLESAAAQIRSALAGVKEESVAFTILKKESKEAEANVARLTEKLNKLNSTERASGTTAFEKMDKQVESLDKKIDGLQSKLTHMKEVRDKLYYIPGGTAKYDAQIKSTEKELALAQKERDSLQSKMDAAVDKDLNLDTNIEEVTHQLEQARSVLEAYNAQRDEMLANGSAYSDKSVVEMTNQLNELEAQLSAMRSAAMETPEFVESVVNGLNEEVDAELTKLSELEQKRDELQQSQDEKAVQAFRSESYYDAYQAAHNNLSDYVDSNKEEIASLEQRAEELKATIEQIRNSGDAANKAFTLEGLEEEYLNAKAKIAEYYDYVSQRAAQLRGHLVKVFGSEEAADEFTNGEKAIGELEGQIEQASARVDELQDKIDSLTNAGGDLEGTVDVAEREVAGEKEDIEKAQAAPTANLDSVNDSVRAASSFLDEYMRKWNQMITVSGMAKNAMATAITPIIHPIQAADRAIGTLIVKTGQLASSLARMAGNAALSFLRRLASEAQNAAIQLAKLASNAVHGAFQKLAQGAAAAGRGLLGLVRNNKAADGSFKRGFMTILKYAFGVRSMYFLFRRLRSAVKEAFTEMAKSSPQVQSAISGLQTALNGLKGSLATAFAPIFTAIAPALTYLINMLTAAMNTIGAFFAALTGQSGFKKAVGMAKSAGGGAGKSAKKAKKEVKELKRELMDFDELHIINGDKDNDAGDGGGGGGGGGAGGGMKFVDAEIPGGIKDFVDKLKELWNNKEYVKIGKLIADWINQAIAKAKELITWENVAQKIQDFVDAVAGIMEGLLIYIDWKNIGDTIAEALRTIVNTIDTFMKKVALFMLAGSALATLVNGFFANEKLWTDIGKTITDSVHAFLAFGQAFLDGFDAEEAGRGIRSAILTVKDKLPEIAAEFWELVKTAFNKAGSFANALLGGGSEEQPDISKYTRKRPATIKPKYSVDESVWDELAKNLSAGFNTAVEKATTFIDKIDVSGAVQALTRWVIKLKNGVNWEGVGILFGAAFRKILDGLGAWIVEWGADADTLGTQIASAINGFIDAAFDGDEIANNFTTLVKGAFKFLDAFLAKLDEENLATGLREAMTGIDWDGIARAAWDAFKTAVGKLGNFLTIMFGGDTGSDPSAAVGEAIRAGKSYQEAIEKAMSGGSGESSVANLAQAIGKAVSSAIDTLDKWINAIKWDKIGAGLHEFLANLPWDEWGQKLAQALLDLFDNLKEFFGNLVFGEEGYKEYKAYKTGDMTGQSKKVESGKVSQDWYEQYAQLSKQVENYVMNGSWTFNIGSALSLTGWEEFTQETQYAYFAALRNAFTGSEIYEYLKSQGKDATGALAEGIELGDIDVSEDGENVVLTFADGTKTQLGKTSEELQQLFNALGVDSVAGLVQAFGDEQGTATDAITEDMNAVVDAANEAVETGSPSKVFEELGTNILAGLKNGLGDLPSELVAIWDSLPEWGKTVLSNLGKTLGININANASGGDSGAVSKDTRKNTKVSKKEIKETQKNTKELKKNTAKRGEVDVNYEGAGFDTSGDKPKLNVGVNFSPEGEEATEENSNKGLLNWLQELLDADTLEAKIALIRDNWESVVNWMYDNGYIGDTLMQLINLAKEGNWASVIDWFDKNGFFGPALSQVVELAKQGKWKDVLDWFKTNGYLSENIDQLVDLVKKGDWTGVIDWLTKNNLFGPKLDQLVDLAKKGDWTGVIDWLKDSGLFGPALQQLIDLAKDGDWTGVIDWLKKKGLAGPAFEQLVKLVKDNWETFFGFLGIDTSNPVIKTLIDLLFGKEDDGAKEALGAKDKNVDVKVDVNKGGNMPVSDAKDVDNLKGGETKKSYTFSGKESSGMSFSDAKDAEKLTGGSTQKTYAFKGSDSGSMSLSNAQKAEGLDGGSKTKTYAFKGSDSGSMGLSNAQKAEGLNGGSETKKYDFNGGLLGALSLALAITAEGLKGGTATKNYTANLDTKGNLSVADAKKVEDLNGGTHTTNYTANLTKKGNMSVHDAEKADGLKTKNPKLTYKATLNKSGNLSASEALKLNGMHGTRTVRIVFKAELQASNKTVKVTSAGNNSWKLASLGGIITNSGIFRHFASGGVIKGGMARYFDNVPHYAGGTTKPHGTVFVAGEAGPEIMGHLNGRTEILNKSQLAQTMYSAVIAAMSTAVNALGRYVANHMTNCTNAIVQTIGTRYPSVDYYAPAMATGGIMPYDVAMQIARSTQELQNTLDSNNEELIQAMVSAIGNAAQSIAQAMVTQSMRGQGRGINSQQVIQDINRAGQMFGQSPIKGV